MTDAFMIWVAVALLGLWSCVGVLLRASKKNEARLDKIIELLRDLNKK